MKGVISAGVLGKIPQTPIKVTNRKNIKISKDFLKRKYTEQKLSQDEIARILGCSQWVISQRLRKFGIKIRDKTWKLSFFRTKYQENQFFFDEITPVTAWTLGLLLSDGFLRERSEKSFGIKLKIKDKDVILKLRRLFKYSGPIYYRAPKSTIYPGGITINDSGSAMLKIYSEYVVNKLKSIGLNENKSLNEKFLDCIKRQNNEQIYSSFIRGIFEGDGSVLFDRKRFSSCFQIVGTQELLKDIQKYLMKYCNVKKTKLTRNIKGKNHFALRYRGNKQAIRILEWIYKDTKRANRMDRKYKDFLLIKREVIER